MIVNEEKLNDCDIRVLNLSLELESIANKLGTVFIVTSGKRSEKYNREIGGSPRSYHLFGLAIDGYFKDVNVFKLVTELYYLVAKQEDVFKGVTEFEVCRNKSGMQHFHFAFANEIGKSDPRFFTGTYNNG